MRFSSTLSLAAALTLTLPAVAQLSTYSASGTAVSNGDGCVELTSGSAGTAGSVWANEALDLAQPFHIQAKVNFGSIDHGAEGVVLVFHTEGADTEGTAYSDFATSFGVEFDTRPQPEFGDIDADHIAMINDGSYLHINSQGTNTAGPVAAFVGEGDLEDGEDHLVDVIWDPSGPEMRVHLDCEERLIGSIDLIDDIFGGERFVTWGFSADATASLNHPRVCLTGNATGTDTEIYACPESAVQLVAGGLDVTTYQWAPSNAVSDPTLQAPVYTGVVSNTLSVTYTNQCGLEITDEVTVLVEEVEVDLVSEGNTLNCTNDGVLMCNASSPFGTYLDYSWFVNNTLMGEGMSFEMSSQGTLELQVTYPGTSSLMCQDEFSMPVVLDTAHFEANAGLPGVISCTNPTLELLGSTSADPSAEIQWTTADGQFAGETNVETPEVSAGGTYTLTVINTENGCESTDSVVITEDLETPEVTLGYIDGMLDCNIPSVSMVGIDVFPQEYTPMYSWTNAETGAEVSQDSQPQFEDAGAYNLQVEFVENGCVTTVEGAAEIESNVDVLDLSELVLPNVITPDNNGNNDRFIPFVPGYEDTNVLTMLDEYHIQVYNRWGALLFENNGQPLQWDGRANGSLVDPGSYVVSVSYYATCGGEQSGELRTTLEVIH
jgi:gliding motility-associated-like protein